VDGTVGAGGHSAGLLAGSAPDGLLLGLDVDPEALELAKERLRAFGERAILVQASYVSLARQLAGLGWERVDGVLLDLGASSMQFDRPERGFSFQTVGPLDMRFSPQTAQTAGDLVNELPERELADLLHRYGEEKRARQIAKAIVKARPLETTTALAGAVAKAMKGPRGGIHPATRTFQALRIAVNDELAANEAVLPQAVEALKPGGRLAVISFHSLEDRIVKRFMRAASREAPLWAGLPDMPPDALPKLALVGRAIFADAAELARNPRARSAVLRAAERLAP
jgi:16S rRNA (cytosine1402-N4)-methyltransferase